MENMVWAELNSERIFLRPEPCAAAVLLSVVADLWPTCKNKTNQTYIGCTSSNRATLKAPINRSCINCLCLPFQSYCLQQDNLQEVLDKIKNLKKYKKRIRKTEKEVHMCSICVIGQKSQVF